jgi:hypothetical protein
MATPSPHQASGQENPDTKTTVAFLGPFNSYSHQVNTLMN